jgi:zinc protease
MVWGALALASSAPAAPGPVGAPDLETLETGLRVAVFEDHRLPIVQIQLLVPAGLASEPGQESGIANLTAQALTAGTTSRSARDFAADLGRLGGTFGASVGRDYVTVSAAFLARDLDAGLELVADATTHPIFPAEAIDPIKRQALNALLQALQNPAAAADEQLWSQVFPSHPYGRHLYGTLETLPGLGLDQIRTFHGGHYRPDRAVLVIAGDVTGAQALAAAREWFGVWSGRAAAGAPSPPPAAPAALRFQILDRPDLERAEIRLGEAAAPRDAPDYLALALANHCLGGASWSRLPRAATIPGSAGDVRTTLTPLRGTGLFSIAASAPPESTAAVVVRLRDQLTGFLAAPIAGEDLERARRYFQNVLPLQLETLAARTSQWLAADFYGLPADFFDRYDARVASVSAAEVTAAAQRWIDPARLTVVIAGPAARIRPGLEKLGPVEVMAAPAALGSKRVRSEDLKPSPEQVRRGRELFDQSLAAHGGADRLRAIKDSAVEGDISLVQAAGEITGVVNQTRKEPFKMVFATRFQGLETSQVLNGRSAWSRSGADSSEIVDADSMQVEALRSGYRSDLVHLLLAGLRPGAVPAYEGRESIAGRTVEVVRLAVPGLDRRRYMFDAENHHLLAIEESAPAVGGEVSRRLFSEFKSADGVLWPMVEERQLDGMRIMLLKLRKVEIDRGVPDRMFERPAQLKPPPIDLHQK